MITLAIPSKGRLKEQALEMLARAGLAVSLPGDERKYQARIKGVESVEVAFLSAAEIAGEIGQGSVDLGITGEDLLRENLADWEARAEIVARLGFGNADVVVAVPDIWLDYRHHGRSRRCRRRLSASATEGGCASPPNTGG